MIYFSKFSVGEAISVYPPKELNCQNYLALNKVKYSNSSLDRRLADYKYCSLDQIIERSLTLENQLVERF
jgi:hypothetical protein